MVKPSIFSSDYKKRVKKIRRRRIIIFLIIFSLGFIYYLINNKKINGIDYIKKVNNGISSKLSSLSKKSDINKNIDNNSIVKKETTKEIVEAKEKVFIVKLDDGTEINIVYEETDGKKIIKSLRGVGSNILYNISPLKDKLVLENKDQNIFLINSEGKITNITKTEYISTDGTVYPKEAILKNNPIYVWSSNPKFIDEDNVAYISSLPWMDGRKSKFIWAVNLNNKVFSYYNGIEGENIKFNSVDTKGLETEVDGKKIFIKSDGTITQ